ncbi:MAG: magnesium/cobalt transporter CorA [Bryobacteraceae bacterium]
MPIAKQPQPPGGFRLGTLTVQPDHLPTRVTILSFDPHGALERAVSAPDQTAAGGDGCRWIHIQGMADPKSIDAVAGSLGLTDPVIEGLGESRQRPKTDWIDDTLVVVLRAPHLAARQKSGLEQICIVAGKDFVLTVQETHSDLVRPVWDRILQGHGSIRNAGPAHLCFAIVDCVVDRYYPALEQLGDHLEELEDRVMESFDEGLLGEVNDVRTELVSLRRVSWPQREAIQRLARNENGYFPTELQGPLRDCYDHCLQVAETVDSYRELLGAVNGTYLSVLGNRTNEVMRVLTIMATVFIPLTFIAGIYGMNFDNMPELHSPYGYPLVWAVMLITAAGLVLFFQRKGWINIGWRKQD